MDLILRKGLVVDGTGKPRFRGDVAVQAGKVVAVGDLSRLSALEEVDASGWVVAPGFVDIHSHSDFTLLVDPRAQSQIAQGVTTEVVGNCGHGCAPITDPVLFEGNIYGYTPDLPIDWRSQAEYLERLDRARPAVNVATLVPNGNLRLAVVGLEDRPATADETRRMADLLRESLDAGAYGYSTGLEYATERGCAPEEIAALGQVVARIGGIYATHTRNRDVGALTAIDEAIAVAAATGVRLQISHIIPRRAGLANAAERALEQVDRARARGLDVAFDSHTRLHGITNLSAALPPWALAGDSVAIARRLRDPESRAVMKRYESLISSFGLGGWDRVSLFSSVGRPDLVGRNLAEASPASRDPFDVIYDVLAAEVETTGSPHGAMCICHSYEESDLQLTFQHPLCTVGSDATALATDGPLASSTFLGAYTWAGWFFRRFVREKAVFTLEEAIHKLSAAAAERIGLTGRGRIVPGHWADLIVFDPNQFGEQGNLTQPNQLALGIERVYVNGVLTWANGRLTGQRGGTVLRR
jgi:N-acyl-D-aspartate/D-glutamate deacylase